MTANPEEPRTPITLEHQVWMLDDIADRDAQTEPITDPAKLPLGRDGTKYDHARERRSDYHLDGYTLAMGDRHLLLEEVRRLQREAAASPEPPRADPQFQAWLASHRSGMHWGCYAGWEGGSCNVENLARSAAPVGLPDPERLYEALWAERDRLDAGVGGFNEVLYRRAARAILARLSSPEPATEPER